MLFFNGLEDSPGTDERQNGQNAAAEAENC